MDKSFKDYKELFLNIINTIQFNDDKEVFINQFTNNIYLHSLVDLIQILSAGDHQKIKQEILASNNNPEKIEEIMKKYFTDDQRTKALEIATKNMMIGFFKEIDSSLSPKQRQKIAELIQEFNSDYASQAVGQI